jgi:hypothetical protein
LEEAEVEKSSTLATNGKLKEMIIIGRALRVEA